MGDGLHYFEALATDSAGNKSITPKVELDVDATADAPVIDAVNDNVDSKTGNVLDVKTKVALTNDSTPTLEGYAEPNSVVTIYEISELNGEKTAIGTVTADKHGGWKFELPELGDGEYQYTTRAQDKAGNISDFSEAVIVNVDLVAPSEPTITFVEDINKKDGKLNKAENGKDGDDASTTAQISVPGDAVENDVIHYTVNGEEKTHTITYNDRVAGYIEVKVPVVDGKTSTVTAKIVDQAGNASEVVKESISSDFTAPNVQITGIIDNVPGGTYKDNVAGTSTNDNKPTIKGKADANQEVVIYDTNKEIGRTTADKNGNWEFKPSDYKEPLADLVGRVHVIKAVVTDAAGNTSEATSALEVDTTVGTPKVKFKEDLNNNEVLSVEEAKALTDGKLHWVVEIPTDGISVKAGDTLQVYGKNAKWQNAAIITNDDITKGFVERDGFVMDLPKGNGVQSPAYRIVDKVGNEGEGNFANLKYDSELTRQPSNPSIKFPEDTNEDGKISDKENKEGDKDAGKTTAEVVIPQDGSVKPGDKLIVTDDNGKKTEKPINQDDIDKGKIDIPVDLNPGKDNTIIAEIVNPNNPDNPGKGKGVIGENSEATKAPEAPVITDVIDDVKGGKFNEDVKGGLTNDNTPTIKGTAKAGSTVVIYDNGVEIGRIEKADANWEFTTPVLTKQGEHKFTAIAENAFGTSVSSNEVTIDLDTKAPTVENVKVTPIDMSNPADSTPEKGRVEGRSDTPGAIVVIKDQAGNEIGRDNVKADKSFTIETTKPINKGDKVTVEITDEAGNTGKGEAEAGNVKHEGDNVAPCDPTITFVEDTAPKDSKLNKAENGSDSDNANTTAKISFLPDVVKGDVIKYTINNGNEQNHTVTADDVKAGYIEVKVPVVDGKTSTVTAKIVDQAGNASKEVSGSVDVDLSVDAPKVRITADADDNNILTATEASTLTDGKLKWVIELPKDAKEGDRLEVSNNHRDWVSVVTLTAADIKAGTITRDDFSADLVKGKLGFQTPSYRIVDQAGNISKEITDSVRFDKSAPKAPVIKEVIDDHKGYDDDERVGDVLKVEGGLTNDNTPTIKGTADAGIKVDIYDNGKFIGTTKADDNGNWGFTPSTSAVLPDGKHSITAVAENALGVKSASSNAANIDVDTVTPKPTIDSITDNVEGGVYKGDVKGGLTNDNRPVFEGKAEKGAFIELFDNDKVIGTTKAGEDGKWTIQPKEPMADGKHNMVVQATDLAGNRSRSDQTSSDVDTTSPGVVKITAVCDDVAGYNGKVGNILGVNNGLTDDSTPTIKGTAKPGVTITIKDGNKVVDGDIKYNGDGSWEFTPKTPLAEGKHELTAIATSKTGVVSNPSNVAAIDVDTKIADAKVEFIEDTNNDGKFSWKENMENTHTGRLSWKALIPDDGSIKAGDIFHYKWDETGWHERAISQAEIDRGYIGEMKNNQIGKDQPDAGKPMPYGKNANGSVYVAEAFFSDAAGNKGAKGSDKIVFDFSDSESGAKTVNVKITSIDDNVPGWNGKTGNIITNEAAHIAGLTNDNTPTISGTTEAGAVVKVSIVNSKTHKVWEGDVKANENGEWSITTGNIADGKYSVVAVATDKSGVTSSPYTVSGLEIDATVAKPNILVAEDRNHDGFYDNVEYHNPANGKGDITFVVEVPKDGSIKAGDTFHYTLNTDYKGWSNINGYGENITISQTDIDNGSFSRVFTLCKDNQHFDLRHDGATVSMKGQFKDLAGNALADETSVKFDLTKVHSGKVRSTRSLPDDILDNDSVDLSKAAHLDEPKTELNVLNNQKIGVSASDLLEAPKDHIMSEGKSEAKTYTSASSHAAEESVATTHHIQIEEKVENHF